jgi:hypothetical protein
MCAGTCRGATPAYYFGVKYDYDIIIGSGPPNLPVGLSAHLYGADTIGNRERISKLNAELLAHLKDSFSSKIVLIYGKEEDTANGDTKAMRTLVEDLRQSTVNYAVHEPDFTEHRMCGIYFPKFLVEFIINNGENTTSNLPAKTSETIFLEEAVNLNETLREILRTLDAPIANNTLFGSKVSNIEILVVGDYKRIFEYANKDYYFIGEYKKSGVLLPTFEIYYKYTISQKGLEWDCTLQTQLLQHYKQSKDIRGFEILEEYMLEFWKQQALEAPKHFGKKGNFVYERGYRRIAYIIQRVHFLIDYHSTLYQNNLSTRFNTAQRITEELAYCYAQLVQYDLFFNNKLSYKLDYNNAFGLFRALLHLAAFFKNDTIICNNTFNVVMKCIIEMFAFEFDDNGYCLGGLSMMNWYVVNYSSLNTFIKANKFIVTEDYEKFEALLVKTTELLAYIVCNNGTLPSIGLTGSAKTTVKPKIGNLLNKNHNIVILRDSLAYITVNSGLHQHIQFPHHDQLSFTFSYNNISFILDADEGDLTKNDNVIDYCRSVFAHSTLICDDFDYELTPYSETFCISKTTQNNNYSLVYMSHKFYQGVIVCRTLLWVKPNILIIADFANSGNKHKYTQNFLINPAKEVVKTEKHVVFIYSDTDSFTITHFDTIDNLDVIKGSKDFDALKPRGYIFPDRKRHQSVSNYAFNKLGTNAQFLTVLEAHSGKGTEFSVSSANLNNDILHVELSNGTIIDVDFEKYGGSNEH